MYKIKHSLIIALTLVFTFVISCKDLDELNINPNGADPESADLNFLLPTTITNLGQTVYGIGFGQLSGVMQHTQQTGWMGGYNNYDWDNLSHSWNGYYGILMNNDEFYKKAVKNKLEFHEGVARVLRAYTFGLITDLWGDAPYSQALKAEQGAAYFKPVFDPQKEIYLGILADLDTANQLLSKSASAYTNIAPKQDVLYGGNPEKWRKFANSLALRYYMRLQAKEPTIAEQGIKKIVQDPSKYPLITVASDDANVSFVGSAKENSNPLNTVYDIALDGAYMRVKMAGTLVDALQKYNDPRLAVWANKVEIPLVLVPGSGIDRIVNGKREVSQDIVTKFETDNTMKVDFDPEYVGVVISHSKVQIFNMNLTNPAQGTKNPHASQLNDRYKKTADPLVLMRLMSAAEVNLILAEAAYRGWISGSAETYYAAGIQQSFSAWGVESSFASYLTRAPYNGLASIIEQKWFASWTTAQESWFDWRRTGLPALVTGPLAVRPVLPIRWYYHYDNEIAKNTANAEAAISRLEPTSYLGTDQSNNSAWSRPWLLQGTGKPY
ncbi:MAG TPA: SusD/RagB family nutrient-binding outer membrane lipoprotein [Prolixibacteraceae bacterium]|nr:SusD/RagB family nutrient-binding outer membrane lipoprotein [Prolixibacteraceae bacterium]